MTIVIEYLICRSTSCAISVEIYINTVSPIKRPNLQKKLLIILPEIGVYLKKINYIGPAPDLCVDGQEFASRSRHNTIITIRPIVVSLGVHAYGVSMGFQTRL